MALSSVGSMRHSRARRNRTSGCEGVSGTRVRIRDHTEPWFFDRSTEPEEKFLIFRSKESIGWLYAGNVARRGGMQYRMLRGRLERVYRPESPAGQAGFYADKWPTLFPWRGDSRCRDLIEQNRGHPDDHCRSRGKQPLVHTSDSSRNSAQPAGSGEPTVTNSDQSFRSRISSVISAMKSATGFAPRSSLSR
jgi:hypothetical protein